VLSTCWLLFLAVPLSSTGIGFPFFLIALVVTVVIGAAELTLMLAQRPLNPLRLLQWLAYPVAAAALLILFLTSQAPANPLFRIRFELSRPALEAAANNAMSQRPPTTPTWLGLFPVRHIDVDEAEVRFLSEECGVIDECGLVYRAGPLPRARSKMKLRALGGPWYHLYSVF
jgi:hypothetical protein